MAKESGISWTDGTFNPWWGCERVSPACARCYAASLAARYGHGDTWGDGSHPFRFFADDHWDEPLRWDATAMEKYGRPMRVFCASMADVFEEREELAEHRLRLFELIVRTPNLRWLLLTKRPEFARDWMRAWYYDRCEDLSEGLLDPPLAWVGRDGIGWGVPPNVWMGVSVENQRWTWRADVLREIPAPVRFISAEPLLQSLIEPVSSRLASGSLPPEPDDDMAEGGTDTYGRGPLDLSGIDWLIVGGESGGRKTRLMHPAWPRELRDACAERGIPFHFKQWGSWAPRPHTSGILPRDVCLSEDGTRDVAGNDYVCFANESDGEVMRYAGMSAKSGGKLLDGIEHCEFPAELVLA